MLIVLQILTVLLALVRQSFAAATSTSCGLSVPMHCKLVRPNPSRHRYSEFRRPAMKCRATNAERPPKHQVEQDLSLISNLITEFKRPAAFAETTLKSFTQSHQFLTQGARDWLTENGLRGGGPEWANERQGVKIQVFLSDGVYYVHVGHTPWTDSTSPGRILRTTDSFLDEIKMWNTIRRCDEENFSEKVFMPDYSFKDSFDNPMKAKLEQVSSMMKDDRQFVYSRYIRILLSSIRSIGNFVQDISGLQDPSNRVVVVNTRRGSWQDMTTAAVASVISTQRLAFAPNEDPNVQLLYLSPPTEKRSKVIVEVLIPEVASRPETRFLFDKLIQIASEDTLKTTKFISAVVSLPTNLISTLLSFMLERKNPLEPLTSSISLEEYRVDPNVVELIGELSPDKNKSYIVC